MEGDGNGIENGEERGKEGSGVHHIKKQAGQKIRLFHSSRGVISGDRRLRLQVANSSGRKTQRLPDDVVLKGEPGTMGTGTRTRIGTDTRAWMTAGTGVGNRDENREEGGGERKPGNLRSDSRGGSKHAREGTTPTGNQ